MRFLIGKDYDEMSKLASQMVINQMQSKPDSVLGLATGSSPVGLYENLSIACKQGQVSFADAKTFNLDEYCGLRPSDPQSYRYFMDQNLFDRIDIDKANTFIPDGLNPTDDECIRYDKMIEDAGGIDIQILGLGHNGHIGFNEPDGSFPVGTHMVKLKESTIKANSRLFDNMDDVPREAITMGIGNIMGARKIIMLVSGADKADIVKRAFEGKVEPLVPASILQLHPNVDVVLDEDAAQSLDMA